MVQAKAAANLKQTAPPQAQKHRLHHHENSRKRQAGAEVTL
jgi:hypothetical protein